MARERTKPRRRSWEPRPSPRARPATDRASPSSTVRAASRSRSASIAAKLTIGRLDGDVRFPDDAFLSPVHAQVAIRDGAFLVRDLGSRNGTWVFTDAPYRLQDGDTLLIGSQLIRFRRLGYPGPHPPEAEPDAPPRIVHARAPTSPCSSSCARTAARATRCTSRRRAASPSAATRATGSFRTTRP